MEQKRYLIELKYENGRRKLLLDETYMCMPSRESVEAFAQKRVHKLNHDFVSSLVGKIAGFEIYECKAQVGADTIRPKEDKI